MLPYAAYPSAAARRPQVVDRGQDEHARWFTLRFEPFQRFPEHRNAATIALRAICGTGILERGVHRAELFPGHEVALRPSELHSVVAGAEGLSLRVTLPVEGSCVVQAGPGDALPDSPSCEIPASGPSACALPAVPSCETRGGPSCECC